MNIVSFKDGTYGIRKGSRFWGYKYFDLVTPRYWWGLGDVYFRDCKRDYETVNKVFKSMDNSDKGTPV